MWAVLIVLIVLVVLYALMKKDKVETPVAGEVTESVELQVDENGIEIAPDSTPVVEDTNDAASTETEVDEEPASSGRVDENGIEIAP